MIEPTPYNEDDIISPLEVELIDTLEGMHSMCKIGSPNDELYFEHPIGSQKAWGRVLYSNATVASIYFVPPLEFSENVTRMKMYTLTQLPEEGLSCIQEDHVLIEDVLTPVTVTAQALSEELITTIHNVVEHAYLSGSYNASTLELAGSVEDRKEKIKKIAPFISRALQRPAFYTLYGPSYVHRMNPSDEK